MANDQENRNFIENDGFWIINEGEVEGTIIGGNQCTLNLCKARNTCRILKVASCSRR